MYIIFCFSYSFSSFLNARLGEAAEEAVKRYQKLCGSGLVCKYDGVLGANGPTRTAMV